MKTTSIRAVLTFGVLVSASALCAAPAIQFGPPTHYTNKLSGVECIGAADFNGDALTDLATIDGQKLTIWTNNRAGGLGLRTNYLAGGAPRVLAAGDLNNDRRADLLTANYGGDSLSAFLGNGDGTFSRVDTAVTVNDYLPGLALGDLNGDGTLDAVLATYGVGVFLGNGNGSFNSFTNYPALLAYAGAIADLNGDHKLDVVTANYSYSSMSVYLGNGDGTLAPPTHYSGDFSEYHYALAVGDFNHDDHPDLTTVNYYNHSVSVRLNNGDGTFGSETKHGVIFGPRSVAVGDFNHDGNLDIVAGQALGTNALAILPGDGTGAFGAALTNFSGLDGSYQSLAVADLDGDGLVDLATTSQARAAVTVRLNQSVALLNIQPLPPQIRLTWPIWTGYLLETSTNLPDSKSWLTATDTPALVCNQYVLTNTATGSGHFYRLRPPLP